MELSFCSDLQYNVICHTNMMIPIVVAIELSSQLSYLYIVVQPVLYLLGTRSSGYRQCVVCVGVCLCMWCLFCTRTPVPLFLLLNTTIRSSLACSRKKISLLIEVIFYHTLNLYIKGSSMRHFTGVKKAQTGQTCAIQPSSPMDVGYYTPAVRTT
jgi:hypothetical protein